MNAIEQEKHDNELVEKICRALETRNTPEFAPGKIPVKKAATIMGKSVLWIQAGMIEGWLPIGIVTKEGKQVKSLQEIKPDSKVDYTIIPSQFYKLTGYIWRGKDDA